MTIEEKKLRLWKHGIDNGWENVSFNCLVAEIVDGKRLRLNFRDEKVLRLEARVPKSKEEKEKEPTRGPMKWLVLREAPYQEVKITDSGEIDFNPKKPKATRKRTTKKKVVKK